MPAETSPAGGTDIDADWDLREIGWRIQVEGDAPLDISVGTPIAADRIHDVIGSKTPFRVVNALPVVCAAPPGIRSTVDLGQVLPYLGR